MLNGPGSTIRRYFSSIFGKQLEDDVFRFARSRLSGVLKIDTKFISKIWKGMSPLPRSQEETEH